MDPSDFLIDQLSKAPSAAFQRQKQIEQRWKNCQTRLQEHEEFASTLINFSQELIDAYKELGSLQTWINSIERNVHVIMYHITSTEVER